MSGDCSNPGISKISYSYFAWKRLKSLSVAFRQTEKKVARMREEIERQLASSEEKRTLLAKIQNKELALQLLSGFLTKRRLQLHTQYARLNQVHHVEDERVTERQRFRERLVTLDDRVKLLQTFLSDLREKCAMMKVQLCVRRKELIKEVADIFHVRHSLSKYPCHCDPVYTICGLHLADAENYAGHPDVETCSALGIVVHLLTLICWIFDVPARYPMHFLSSRSMIDDYVNSELSDLKRNFYLTGRRQEKILFNYAVFLLNKNLAQLRHYFGLQTDNLRCTLLNLSSLTDELCGMSTMNDADFPRSRNGSPPPHVPSLKAIHDTGLAIDRSLSFPCLTTFYEFPFADRSREKEVEKRSYKSDSPELLVHEKADDWTTLFIERLKVDYSSEVVKQ